MTTLTIEKLADTVGAAVIGADPDVLVSDDAIATWCLDALEANGVLVFKDLHLDDATQVAFSKRLGAVETFPNSDPPEIFRVTLDPTKNPAAAYLRGTFDWHIDGCTDDIPIMATMLSAHARSPSVRVGRRSSPAPTSAYERLSTTTTRSASPNRCVSCTLDRGDPAAACTPIRRRRAVGNVARRGRPRPTRSCGSTIARAGSRLVLGATAHYVVGHGPRRVSMRCSTDLLAASSTEPDHVYRHEWSVGDVVHLGQPRRAAPSPALRPDLAARHAPHDAHG